MFYTMQASTQISTFNFQEQNIRVVSINNNPWFIAKDVMRVLEVKNVPQALSRLEPEERDTFILNEGIPGNPETNIISESGFYTIVLSSRKPIAKPFKNWVTREVLPELRKYGYYEVKGNTTVINDIPSPPVPLVQDAEEIIVDSMISTLHILKQTRQRLDQVEETTNIHTSSLNKVENVTKLHTGVLGEVKDIIELQANALEELEGTTSNRHSLVVDQLYDLETRLNQLETPVPVKYIDNNQESSQTEIANYLIHANQQLRTSASSLPAPTQQLPDITIETHLNNIVKSYVIRQQCQNDNITFQTAYNLLYKKYLDIFHINIKARCEEHNRHYSPKLTVLKYAVKFDLIQDLYNTAYNLFITGSI